MAEARIRILGPADAEAYAALRTEALVDSPLAFLSSPDDDLAATVARTRPMLARAPGSVVFGVFAEGLLGIVGIRQDDHVKAAHKAHLWGMYVTPKWRRRGLASALSRAALDHAATLPGVTWVHLGVSDAMPAAERLYSSLGFERWGSEPEALQHEGRMADEHHMALRLPQG
jgi:RimJ/RimL family protein N-acetyltransferase